MERVHVRVVQGRKVLLPCGIEHVAVGSTAWLGRQRRGGSPLAPLLRLIHVANASQQARGFVTRPVVVFLQVDCPAQPEVEEDTCRTSNQGDLHPGNDSFNYSITFQCIRPVNHVKYTVRLICVQGSLTSYKVQVREPCQGSRTRHDLGAGFAASPLASFYVRRLGSRRKSVTVQATHLRVRAPSDTH